MVLYNVNGCQIDTIRKKEDEDYNAETEICLRGFPHIKMALSEIFEGVD